jgi:hypothetical protein
VFVAAKGQSSADEAGNAGGKRPDRIDATQPGGHALISASPKNETGEMVVLFRYRHSDLRVVASMSRGR